MEVEKTQEDMSDKTGKEEKANHSPGYPEAHWISPPSHTGESIVFASSSNEMKKEGNKKKKCQG